LKSAFGKDWNYNYYQFNASKTKIDEIRDKVIDLAEKDPIGEYTAPNGKVYNIPFNTIFFDEIDWLPPKSQAALRRIMEIHEYTRFILSCNYDFKVINALKSRCMPLHFGRLDPKDIKQIVKPIIERENINIDDDALELLCDISNGDARKAQNILYKAQLTGKIDLDEIKRCADTIIVKFNTKILEIAIVAKNKNDDEYNKDFKILESQIDKLYYKNGYSGTQILMNIFDSVVEDDKMPTSVKRQIFSKISECMRDCSLVYDDIYALKMWLRSI
jgi:DNA polymerase III delta prime subunit